jgi:hypothetical protein
MAVVLGVEFIEEGLNVRFVHAIHGIPRTFGIVGIETGPHHGLPLRLRDFVLAEFEASGQKHSGPTLRACLNYA